ncbi:unnamed protein product [Blepharisma stoltei]|uniref:Uncharacterized protein n=1 Tax=Blepharisma stoltei TaxID=1481888 RepID=A0AAU9J297_9CILI|nr:unnamed protein product [Blepharisma stoltei]
MMDFDPTSLLKQMRNKTPIRSVPELPPRNNFDEADLLNKISKLEAQVSNLENQLKISQEAEQKAVKEKSLLNEQFKEFQMRMMNNEKKMNERIEKLENLLESEKNKNKNRDKEENKENRSKTPPLPPRIELKKPVFSSAVSTNSSRYAASKQKGYLDLTPLIELYKVMPDFPRPVLKVDFSQHRIEEDQ